MSTNANEIIAYFKNLQDNISAGLEQLESDSGATFREDRWDRPGGGGGRTRIIEGVIIEKGGVNFSEVHGEMPEKIASSLGLSKTNFLASGVSIVLHPGSPMVPIIHMNVRYFETTEGTWWFGGGIDLTPHYIVAEDAVFFHQQMKDVCDKHHIGFYPKFKKWADDYFFIRHRNETRGIGGIFFDQLKGDSAMGLDKQQIFSFVQEVGNTFLPTYLELAQRNKDREYNDAHKEWQMVRRGRYVEFNLVWDRGTKFGLETNGRTESILMSLPKTAQWFYDYQVEEGSDEQKTLQRLVKDYNWLEE